MTKPVRPYSRVYWQARDDVKFARVWSDDRVLGCWLRLLVAADMAWPASADLYLGIHRPSLHILTEAGLVDVLTSGAYRIHGLDKERNERSDSARLAAVVRHTGSIAGMPPEPNRSADGMRPQPMSSAEGMPRQDEPRRDEQRREVATRNADERPRRRQMAYLRGELTEAELADLRAADAIPGKAKGDAA